MYVILGFRRALLARKNVKVKHLSRQQRARNPRSAAVGETQLACRQDPCPRPPSVLGSSCGSFPRAVTAPRSVLRFLRGQERSTFSQESYVSSVRRRKLESQGRHPANSYAAFVLCPLILLGSHREPSFRRRLPLCGTVLARQTWSF
jgi:hypothetical protein